MSSSWTVGETLPSPSVPPSRRVGEWLADLQRRHVESRRHEQTPLTDVQAWSPFGRGAQLFESLLVVENLPLDTLQAVVLSAKLRRLDAWNEQRRTAAGRYDELLAEVKGVRLPVTAPGNEHVWHLYVVRVPRRDDELFGEDRPFGGIHRGGLNGLWLDGSARWMSDATPPNLFREQATLAGREE